MSYNAKNYTEQGGDVTRIGGTLIFEEGCSVKRLPRCLGIMECQPDSEATTVEELRADFNALLDNLKLHDYMAADHYSYDEDEENQEDQENQEPDGDPETEGNQDNGGE